MDLVVLEKIESCILNSLGCIVRLEKNSGNDNKKVKVKFNLFIIFGYAEVQLEKIFMFALKNK